MALEIGSRIHDIGIMQILLQFLKEPFLLRDVAHDMQLVVLAFQAELLPHIHEEIESIAAMVDFKRIAELETVLLEAEYVELAFVEVGIELVAMARETTLVEIAPDWCHRLDEDHVVELVAENSAEVSVDGKETDGLQIGQHIV